MITQQKTVEILWTGGFDSSFRIAQLSRMNVIIRPYYLSDNRDSERYELNAIKRITEYLKANKETKCSFEPLQYIPFNARRHSERIANAFNHLREKHYMGEQYEWLATFAEEHNGIELSIHKDDKAIILISQYCNPRKISDEVIGDYYVVDNSNDDLFTVFGNFHLPLAPFTKIDMKREYSNLGLNDISKMTWFCFNPINGKPCGRCNPCQYTIEEGLWYRFTPLALLRYFHRKIR